eukprot:Sdes_comp20884_c1_seq1m17940
MVRLAPLSVPLNRRLQTLTVMLFWAAIPLSFVLCLCMLLSPFWWGLIVPYLVFVALDKCPRFGGRRILSYKRLKLWNHFRDYFPVSLIKSSELDPSKNYVFGYHPHGIISLGALVNFATDATNFSGIFPGIDLRLLTLRQNFYIPFYREHLPSL